MKRFTALLVLLVSSFTPALSQLKVDGLPGGAVILEKRNLGTAKHPDRTLVLWMLRPTKYPNHYKPDDIYTCPDYTRGSYYSGPTRVSLVDARSGKIINTIKILSEYDDGKDSVDVPYAIRRGYYYRVVSAAKRGVEAKPNIIWLRDYNGDGKALEFAMFDAEACMGLGTSLIGYSEKTDRVVQYPLLLQPPAGTNQAVQTMYWIDYLFSKKPVRPGYWNYEIDYRGRGGPLEKWNIRYNAEKEQFEGTLTSVPE